MNSASTMGKLPRTIRMDPSDTFVFERAAEPGEWAVSGAFVFHGCEPASLPTKQRTAFRAGFIGLSSFGYSTLAVVSEASGPEHDEATTLLALKLVERFGAPDLAIALPAAREEIAFAADLCKGHAVGTLLALHRTEEGGRIRERFRTLKPREAGSDPHAAAMRGHGKAFFLVETNEDDEAEEHVDLVGLMSEKQR
jgi:hypothetical protein